MSTNGIGVGVDMESTERFRSLDRLRHKHFLARVFTQAELTYCFSKPLPEAHLAARFVAKEAVIKALAVLGIHTLTYCDIEVVHTPKGVPSVKLPKQWSDVHVAVSLSHTTDAALAFVVAHQGCG